jgi:hypothetical protein
MWLMPPPFGTRLTTLLDAQAVVSACQLPAQWLKDHTRGSSLPHRLCLLAKFQEYCPLTTAPSTGKGTHFWNEATAQHTACHTLLGSNTATRAAQLLHITE